LIPVLRRNLSHIRLVLLLLALLAAGCSRKEEETKLPPEELGGAPTFVVDAKTLPKTLKIIAYGDVRFTDASERVQSHPIARRALVAKITAEQPDALLVTGDLPFRGSHSEDWAVVHNETQPWRDAKLRIYPSLGNHELRGGVKIGLQNWWAEFPELKNRRWYSVQFGNCYIITLDSDTSLNPGSAQDQWLTAQLAHLPASTDFVFLLMHHPSYTDSEDLSGHSAAMQEKKLARRLEAMTASAAAAGPPAGSSESPSSTTPSAGPKLIEIAGHVHNYERFMHGGVTYLVSGGGGASPYLFHRSSEDQYQGGREPTYHYITFTITGTQLKAVMTKLMNPDSANSQPKWEDKDSFELTAPARVTAH
jgi:3',5'-cyclic AMP phosphodiesterase CpdA